MTYGTETVAYSGERKVQCHFFTRQVALQMDQSVTRPDSDALSEQRAVSSAGERALHTRQAGGSNPSPPTIPRRCGVCWRCQDPCPYGGPYIGYQHVAADGLTYIGPVETIGP